MIEVAIVVVVVAAAAAVVVLAARRSRGIIVASILGATAIATVAFRPREAAGVHPARPQPPRASTYVGSAACRGCHPSEHASFSRTWHRTMTQDATPRTVLAPYDARMVLTTGSHREQAYWVAGDDGSLVLAPYVWLVREKRTIPRKDAFLTPPDREVPSPKWSSSCIACHAVAGEPHDGKDVRAAELGIACEACHGPGAAHVEKHRDPVARYVQYASNSLDPTIVQPRRLPPARSAAVCGQCHAYAFPRDVDGWWATGYARSFRAGDDLAPSRFLITPESFDDPGAPRVDADARSLFWPDGAIRVGGREYNGLVQSPCWRGQGDRQITCVSCHAMHSGDPAGQIDPKKTGDRGCTSCHASTREHSHHTSVGCVDCHMTKTSYALFSAVRSHRIESPNAALTMDTGKPNACNLCHLDRTLAWTAQRLTEWYGQKPVQDARSDVAEGTYEALAGDAAVRVVVADALGARGEPWRASVLAELVADPYAAVRFVAARSLRAQPGFADMDIDFLGDAEESRRRVLSRTAPVDPDRQILSHRDLRAVTIAE